MIAWVVIGIAAGIALWLAGFWAGSMLTRSMREVITRDVPQIITTEKVVEIEKPVIVQMPATVQKQPPRATTGPSLPVMGATRHVIADPAERQQMERIQQLTGNTPEA
jgi:hypothetical protein